MRIKLTQTLNYFSLLPIVSPAQQAYVRLSEAPRLSLHTGIDQKRTACNVTVRLSVLLIQTEFAVHMGSRVSERPTYL